ncbi:MAG: hypothetical protein MHM6MM_000850 [Cercozoa sp. M6MM]
MSKASKNDKAERFVRPTLVKAHTRPVVCVVFNKEGDLFATCGKDKPISLFYSRNCERIGTFDGHEGSVYEICMDGKSKFLLSASADYTARVWNLLTGEEIQKFEFQSPARSVHFSNDDKMFLVVGDQAMGQQASVFLFKRGDDGEFVDNRREIARASHKGKILRARFVDNNENVLTMGDDGYLRKFSVESGEQVAEVRASREALTHMKLSPDQCMVLVGSKDMNARLFDVETLELLKTYKTDTPVNGVDFHPTRDIIVLGGGQDARDVTQTAAASGKFESHFYHIVYEEKLYSVRGHFSPINAIAVSPDGTRFISGAEEGIARMHVFPDGFVNDNAF